MNWGWTQKRLGEAVSSNPKTVWHWEKGIQSPSEAALGALAALFGLPKTALVTGKGFQLPGPPQQMAGMLVAENYANDMVVLPKVRDGFIATIDKETGRHLEKPWTHVLSEIRAAREDGRSIWVVFGPSAPTPS
jgi:transcriptional regulator with XRE-family HTH domain